MTKWLTGIAAITAFLAVFTTQAPVANAMHGSDQDVVRDVRGQVVTSTNGNCVYTKWISVTGGCGSMMLSLDERTVYFAFNSSALTAEAKKRLDALAAKLKGNTAVTGAKIFGYADRIGGAQYNDKLSQKRAHSVARYLTRRGVVNARATDTQWFGETQPATSCPEGLKRKALIECLWRDRRVEVEVEYLRNVTVSKR